MISKKPSMDRAMNILGSVYVSISLLVAGIVALAIGTIVESQTGLETALSTIYRTFWFDLYLLLIAVNLIVAVINRRPLERHQWAYVLTHFAIVLLLCGAWITRTFGVEGQAVIQEGMVSEFLYTSESEITLVNESQPAAHSIRIALADTVFPSSKVLSESSEDTPKIELLRYLPFGLAHIELESVEGGSPGVEVQLLAINGRIDTWLLADHQSFRARDVGPVQVEMIQIRREGEFQKRLLPFSATSTQIHIDPGNGLEEIAIPIPGQIGQKIELGNGTSARVLEYFSNATVGETGLHEGNDGKNNPAVRIAISRGNQTEVQTIFSLFPDFNLRSGGASEPLVASIRLNIASRVEKPLISILSGPEEKLYIQTTSAAGRAAARPAIVGETVTLGGIGLSLTLTKFVAQGSPKTIVEPSSASVENAAPAVQLRVSQGPDQNDFWIPRDGYQRALLDGTTYRFAFTRDKRDLPFSIHLDSFEVQNHPGSDQPASHASHVTLRDLAGNVPDLSTVISLNVPIDYLGYRLIQSGYRTGVDGAADATILSLSFDPGVSIVYIAFVLLILGVGWHAFGVGHRRRRSNRELIPRASMSNRTGDTPPKTDQRDLPSTSTEKRNRESIPPLLLIGALLFASQPVETPGVFDQALESTAS